MKRLVIHPPHFAKRLKDGINRGLRAATGFELMLVKSRRGGCSTHPYMAQLLREHSADDLLKLEYGIFNTKTGTFHLLHDAGLFSCLTASLWSISDLLRTGFAPQAVSFRGSCNAFKDRPDSDPFLDFFAPAVSAASTVTTTPKLHLDRLGRFDFHGDYRRIDHEVLQPLVHRFFKPTSQVEARAAEFRQRWLQPSASYVAVWIRGTDKSAEVTPLDSSIYIEAAQRMLDDGRADRVLIQTDQAQIYKLFKGYFGNVCDAIEDLSRTEGRTGIHQTNDMAGRRLGFGVDLLAAVQLIAELPLVVTHTGNIGSWLCLRRGHGRGMWQARPVGLLPLFD